MSSESNFSFTTKVEGDLFTIRGDSFSEFVTHLSETAGVVAVNNLLNVLNRLTPQETQAVAVIQGAIPATIVTYDADKVNAPAVPQQTSFAPVPPPAVAPVVAGTTSCIHGVMNAKKGNGAKGEWRGWFCPTAKGTPDQCKPQFIQKGSPEWVAFPA